MARYSTSPSLTWTLLGNTAYVGSSSSAASDVWPGQRSDHVHTYQLVCLTPMLLATFEAMKGISTAQQSNAEQCFAPQNRAIMCSAILIQFYCHATQSGAKQAKLIIPMSSKAKQCTARHSIAKPSSTRGQHDRLHQEKT